MKNLKNLGKILNKNQQQSIKGGIEKCTDAQKISCEADGHTWVDVPAGPCLGVCLCDGQNKQ